MSTSDRTESVEIWKDVVGFKGLYQVSNLGRIKSLYRIQYRGINQKIYPLNGRILKPQKSNKCGHRIVHLGKGSPRLVHRLVLEAFVGPCPKGMECCHNNGDPSDNRLENLRWDTPKSNSADRTIHGTAFNGPKGDTHPSARLTTEKVKLMREDFSTGKYSLASLGRKYKVHIMTVNDVVKRKTWKHVP